MTSNDCSCVPSSVLVNRPNVYVSAWPCMSLLRHPSHVMTCSLPGLIMSIVPCSVMLRNLILCYVVLSNLPTYLPTCLTLDLASCRLQDPIMEVRHQFALKVHQMIQDFQKDPTKGHKAAKWAAVFPLAAMDPTQANCQSAYNFLMEFVAVRR